MAKLTNIQWMSGGRKLQGGTLNSLVGCSPISEGCANCYATAECWMKQCRSDDLGKDFAGTVEELSNGKPRFTGKVNYIRKRLLAVLKDHQRRSYFVNSLSDVFHDNVTDAIILEHFNTFAQAYWQEFRILTKRPERVVAMNQQIAWPENVQMGVTVESVRRLNRIVLLGQTDAKHKFISFEPWLTPWPEDPTQSIRNAFPLTIDGKVYPALRDLLRASRIECCIVGGESAKVKEAARYFGIDDALYILEEARAAGAHPCLKQLGTRWAIASNTYDSRGRGRLGVTHGGNKGFWPSELKKYSQTWPNLALPEWRPGEKE